MPRGNWHPRPSCKDCGHRPSDPDREALRRAETARLSAERDVTGPTCADCGHVHTATGCAGPPTLSDRWAGVTPAVCDCPTPPAAGRTDTG